MGRRQTISPAMRAEVIRTYGNDCWLGLPGCTRLGEEDDHIRPHHLGGRDTVDHSDHHPDCRSDMDRQ